MPAPDSPRGRRSEDTKRQRGRREETVDENRDDATFRHEQERRRSRQRREERTPALPARTKTRNRRDAGEAPRLLLHVREASSLKRRFPLSRRVFNHAGAFDAPFKPTPWYAPTKCVQLPSSRTPLRHHAASRSPLASSSWANSGTADLTMRPSARTCTQSGVM